MLRARFIGKQRFVPEAPVSLSRRRIFSNQTFGAASGVVTMSSPNAFTTHVFGAGVAMSPVDRWTLELPLADNPLAR